MAEPEQPRADADEYVRWAYRLLLGREPENEAAVRNNPSKSDRQRLLRSFLGSEEFRRVNPLLSADLAQFEGAAVSEETAADIRQIVEERADEVALLHDYRCLDRAGRVAVLASLRHARGAVFTRPWQQQNAHTTNQSDIASLFRIVLGRNPEQLEWHGHVDGEVGHALDEIARRFLTSLEFSRRGLLAAAAPSAVELTSIEGFRMFAARDDLAVGSHVLAGAYEPHVTAVFRHYLRPGMHVVDVGANIGYFTLLAASVVGADGSVLAVEANPDNAKLLEASRRLNDFGWVTVVNVAAGNDVGLLGLTTDYSNGITAPIGAMDELWRARLVPSLPLSAIVPEGRHVDFLKIDIEGAEYLALSAFESVLRRDRPIIVSEFAPAPLRGISAVLPETYLGFFVACGLELATIEADGTITPFGADAGGVIRAWEAARRDHIDIVAAPPQRL